MRQVAGTGEGGSTAASVSPRNKAAEKHPPVVSIFPHFSSDFLSLFHHSSPIGRVGYAKFIQISGKSDTSLGGNLN